MSEFYYAGGRKVELDRATDYVAVVEQTAREAGLDARVQKSSEEGSRRGGGVVLVERSALDEKTLATLRDVGALQPVYRKDRAVMVPLPEVRVEFDTPAQHQAVLDTLTHRDTPPHKIVQETDYAMVVQPTSGSGDDAVTLANEIYERAHPAAASARFVQFVPKRETGS
ncbi:hypothetical protein CQY20_09275 [Mycolicibacterium agri]|uniref:Uncharacterized protein n=1 Tax=Mycolicibacterium agri TaxID=36811 RepID=A0A2A7N769_MYCAG|nr:hypothetical protein [Mycolicibacterium agri]PEG39734.1 hypothetical protein CQY20_09275 [Mycolicibacterium agri]GFG52558.1 hypothetical protein MAGR_39990 [Mycolicibacterium agri]